MVQLARGGLSMLVPAPWVLEFRVCGYFDIELADRMLELADKELDRTLARFVAFHDWDEMTSYDTRARLRLTAWVLTNRERFDAIHILTNASLVSMGVSVANMALGRFMTSYGPRERDRYDAALREAVERASGPVSWRVRMPK